MPQVPGLVPTERPSSQGTPELNVAGVSAEAFGGAMGHALSGLGQELGQAGDKLWQRAVEIQNLNNETEAKNADAEYMMEAGKLHEQFKLQEGLNAAKALPDHIQALQDLRTKIRDNLSNPMAQKMYDGSSLSNMGRYVFNASGLAGQQGKVAANNASSARVDQMINGIGATPTDEVGYQRYTSAIRSEVQTMGERGGWTPEQTANTAEAKISEATATRIASLSKTDVFGAQKMLDTAVKAGTLRENDALKVQATVQGQFRQTGSRMIADEVLKDRRAGEEEDRPLEDYVAAGRKLVADRGYDKDDPLFQSFVDDRIATKYKQQKSVERDSDNQNVTNIGKAMMKANAEGILPTTIEELQAIDPNVGPAWEALGRTPAKQKAILDQLQRNASGAARVPITPDNLRMFHEAKGRAMDPNDEVRAAFMAKDWASDPKLAVSQKNALMNMQDAMRKQSQSDPRVARALHILLPDMNSAGIARSKDADKNKDYYRFTGALADALEQFQKDHPNNPMPKAEEVKAIGAQLMQEHITSKGWLWDSKSPFYQLAAPPQERERLKNDPAWAKRNITPNDDMIDRIYRAEQFRKYYGGTAASDDKTNFPPNAPARP